MYTLVTDQMKEVEKAVINMGEYQFKPEYKSLEVSSERWFLMSCDQRQKHLKKVLDKSCTPFEDSIANSSSYVSSANTKCLSIPPEKCGISTISAE